MVEALFVFLIIAGSALLAIPLFLGSSGIAKGSKLSEFEREILAAIGLDEIPGLEIAERMSKPGKKVSIGRLYPGLQSLSERGLILSRWDKSDSGRDRCYHSVSALGVLAQCDRK